MDSLLRLFGVGLCLASLMIAIDLGAQASDSSEPPPVQVIVARGDHFTVQFWPNRSWHGNSIVGQVTPFSTDPGQDHVKLADVPVKLVRFERAGARSTISDAELSSGALSLDEFQEKLGKELRELDRASVRTGDHGSFSFENLAAGLYSVQIDWTSVPDGVDFLSLSVRYPERAGGRQSLLVPAAGALTSSATGEQP